MDSQAKYEAKRFHIVDYIVFVLMFVLSLAIGVYFSIKSRKQNTTDNYLLGKRKLGLFPVTISMSVSTVSTALLLGAPAEQYYYGAMVQFTAIPAILSLMITAFWIVPWLYPLKIISINKYLKLRFESKAVQITGTLLMLLAQTMYIGCVIFGPATALETVTGIPVWGSIIMIGVIGTVYTTMGGIKAVIWTDVFQAFVMFAGLITLVIKGCILCGGISQVWKHNEKQGRFVVNTSTDPTERMTVISTLLGYLTFFLAMYGVNQPSVQRFCCMESLNRAKIVVLMTIVPTTLFKLLVALVGLVAFAHYHQQGCDPLASGLIKNSNQITPYFAMDILSTPGIPGLFISSLLCASLSTFSSSINSMSAVFWDDILADRLRHLSQKNKTRTTKALSLMFGIICMGIAFIVSSLKGSLVQISFSFFGYALSPLLAIFLLGGLIPWANWLGVILATGIGMVLSGVFLVGQVNHKTHLEPLPTRVDLCQHMGWMNDTDYYWNNTQAVFPISSVPTPSNITILSVGNKDELEVPWIFRVSFMWNTTVGFSLVFIIGAVLSLFTRMFVKKSNYPTSLLLNGIKQCVPDPKNSPYEDNHLTPEKDELESQTLM